MEDSHHLSLQKIAVFSILALILTAGIAFAIKNLINNEVTPSEIISKSKIPTLAPSSDVTIESAVSPSDEIARGKTYINNTHGYSLQIPEDYQVDEAVSENDVGIGSKNEKININITTDPWTSVCANSSSCEKMRLISLALIGKNYPAQEYYVNRGYWYAGYSFQIESGIITEKKTALFLKADYDQPKDFEEISQILSTFKFTTNGENCVAEGGKGNYTSGPRCCQSLVATDCSLSSDPPCAAMESTCFKCIKCGDGKCGNGETKCNCPSDCN